VTGTTPTGPTKRALRALADGESTDAEPAAGIVDEATEALKSVEAAVRFLDGRGVERLARAVVTLGRDGDTARVRRGRDALGALRAFQSALDDRWEGTPTGS
jgi:hypothetical protein